MSTPEELAASLKEIRRDIKRLRISDREQKRRLQTQRQWTMVFFGVMGVGLLMREGISLSAENRKSLEDVAVSAVVIFLGGLGVAGVNLEKFEPTKEPPEEDGEDED